ncbi:MAG TPA: hypothetical protein VFX16_16985 [Pseudonocardiaceae bacterium]|nr:hypothetical protein [Pseudonocardiaceae bacterium]
MGGGAVVPYVALWTEERALPYQLIQRGGLGIGYADETSVDRDQCGVLWSRMGSRPGQGRPVYRQMHPLRQRRAMRRLLCQVCGQPADETEQGHLWLLVDGRPGGESDWPEGVANPFPPVCIDCGRLSARLCPPLRRAHVAVRAHSAIHGVSGVQFCSAGGSDLAFAPGDDGEPVAYEDPAARWTLATQLTRVLLDCTVVDLDRL